MTRKVAASLLLILCLGLLTGCWSRKEIQELAFVTAIAVDWDDEHGEHVVTLQVVRIEFVSRPGERAGGGSEQRPYAFLTARGRTTAEAFSKLQQIQGLHLYYSHLSVVVLGEAAARRGFGSVLDHLWRHNEIRPYIDLAVAPGVAQEVLGAATTQSVITGRWAMGLLERGNYHGYVRSLPLSEMLYAVLTPGRAAALPVISKEETGTPDPATVPSFSEMKGAGMAVFDRDRLVNLLSPEESRGLLLLSGKVRSALITADTGGELTSVRLLSTRTAQEVGPTGAKGLPAMTVRIDARAEIIQRQRTPDSLENSDVTRIEQAAAAQIKREAEMALAATKEAGADVAGFGETLRQRQPAVWHRVTGQWDQKYRELPVRVEVTVRIRRTGILR